MTQHDIDQLARRIRVILVDAKTQQLGHKYKLSAKMDQFKFFQRAAEQCMELEADPVDYIAAAVENCGISGGPFPNQLGGQAAKAWYLKFKEGRGISDEELVRIKVRKTKNAAGEEVEEVITETIYACDADLQMDVDIVHSIIYHNTGSFAIGEGALKILRDPNFPLPIGGRAIVGFGDEQVLRTFAREIYNYFKLQPNYLMAARRMKCPIDEILTWINQILIS
jgi:hypothetical protein